MKKSLIGLSLFGVSILSLTACGGNSDMGKKVNSITINYGDKNVEINNKMDAKDVIDLLSDYNSLYLGYSIKVGAMYDYHLECNSQQIYTNCYDYDDNKYYNKTETIYDVKLDNVALLDDYTAYNVETGYIKENLNNIDVNHGYCRKGIENNNIVSYEIAYDIFDLPIYYSYTHNYNFRTMTAEERNAQQELINAPRKVGDYEFYYDVDRPYFVCRSAEFAGERYSDAVLPYNNVYFNADYCTDLSFKLTDKYIVFNFTEEYKSNDLYEATETITNGEIWFDYKNLSEHTDGSYSINAYYYKIDTLDTTTLTGKNPNETEAVFKSVYQSKIEAKDKMLSRGEITKKIDDFLDKYKKNNSYKEA